MTWLLAAAALTACTTPEPLRQLTHETGDNAVALSVQLERLGQQSRAIAADRADAIARLSREVVEADAILLNDQTLYKEANDSGKLTQFNEVKRISDAVTKTVVDARGTAERELSTIMREQGALDTKSKELGVVGTDLLTMAQDDNLSARAAFFGKFVTAVADDVKKAQNDAKASAAKAHDNTKKNLSLGTGLPPPTQ